MHARRWIAVGCLLPLILAGCGGGSMTNTVPPPATPVPVSGNWTFGIAPTGSVTTPAELPVLIAGSLMVSGTQLSADFLAIQFATTSTTNCTQPTTPDVTLTGTVAKGQISLTSASWGGAILTVTGTVGSDGQSVSGTWSAKGGCIDGRSGSFLANYVPPVTGTWAGTASSVPGLTGATTNSPLAGATLTFQLQQSATPTQYSFPLSGSVMVSGSNCGFTQGTLIQSPLGTGGSPSFVVGNTWLLEAKMDDGKSTMIAAVVPLLNSTQPVAVLTVAGGACDQATAQVTLTRE